MIDTESQIGVSLKFRPLFKLYDENYHHEIDTVIITGGRYSLKSYTVSIFALIALVRYGWNILYTRYTNMSLIDSVKPEVSDKIEMLGLSGTVHDTTTHLEFNGSRISFKGIKTGSLGQTANLKSLSGFNVFINDEAEELPDYKTFKKVFYSMRSITKRNLTILILNPTTKEHWIFKEFFEKKGLKGGDNCIKDNVMYIHSSYLDADQNQIPKNILADYNRLKVDDPKEYNNIVMGGWISELEGQVFSEGSLKRYRDLPDNMEYFTIAYVDSADEGKDHFAMPIARVYGNRVYIIDCIFDQENLTIQEGQVIGKVKEHRISTLAIETNSFGAYFSRRIRELLPEVEVFGMFSKTNKMGRILANAGLIKAYFYFPEKPNPALQKFMDQTVKLLKTDKEEDDAADSLSGLSAYLEKYLQLFREIE
jgi:predicted phage terminase large subunit-like protein